MSATGTKGGHAGGTVTAGARPGPAADSSGAARSYAKVIGSALVVLGLAGFVGNPIIGEPTSHPLFVTGGVHDTLHLMAGALALYIAYGLRAAQQPSAVVALGAVFLVLLVLTILSPNLFGILGASPGHDANAADHLLHLVLGAASIAVGVVSGGVAASLRR